MLTPQGFLFISSPGSITPYHFDPEHNILLQLRGTKVMNVWPAGDERFAPRTQHERYRSEEHTSELQSLMRISYAVFCLKKKTTPTLYCETTTTTYTQQ